MTVTPLQSLLVSEMTQRCNHSSAVDEQKEATKVNFNLTPHVWFDLTCSGWPDGEKRNNSWMMTRLNHRDSRIPSC